MIDKKLAEILSHDSAPDVNINARKRAVNLAVAEFKVVQQEKSQKTSQGFSLLSRLMFISNKKRGVETMEQKLNRKSHKKLYQGCALMVISASLLSIPILLESMSETIDAGGAGVSASTSTLQSVQFSVGGGGGGGANNFAVIAENINTSISSPASTRVKSLGKSKMRREMLSEKKDAGSYTMLGQGIIAMDSDIVAPTYKEVGRDKFEDFEANPFKAVSAEPVSTFSSDVDTASYSFVRRQLNNGVLPQKDAVRIEEMINYFDYNYPVPDSKAEPFQPTVAVTDSPWAEGKKLLHIGIKGYDLKTEQPRSNLVFLLDVSGSMNSADKLPLVKNSMKMLLDSLHPDDTVSIVTYAGHTGVVLEPTKVSESRKIISAMNNLNAGGGTAGAAGITLAYDMAEQNFDENAVNRVILATDGDFNVGITNREELQDFVERKRDKGIFLSVLGFGQGNYHDHMMQVLAQNGNGVAAYIDNLNEARKVLVEEATSSLFPIAKDVKFQIEFNPAVVEEYRLIGYETRHLSREDFNNDKVDAGDMGAGHSVTAIYEFVPVGSNAVSVDSLRYGGVEPKLEDSRDNGEYAFLKIRYKLPSENKSNLITTPVTAENDMSRLGVSYEGWMYTDTNFSTAVAAFGQILKGGEYTGDFTYEDVIALAQQGKGEDKFGYRAEFIQMVRLAQTHSR